MLNKFDLLEAQEKEKKHLSYLERLWDSLPLSQKERIENVVESLKANGTICTVFDFIKIPC